MVLVNRSKNNKNINIKQIILFMIKMQKYINMIKSIHKKLQNDANIQRTINNIFNYTS